MNKPTREQIIDYARGLAGPEVSKMVESDPASVSEAEAFRLVFQAGREPAPEMWMLRAKALLPAQDRTIPLLFGQLRPALQGATGVRAGAPAPGTYSFDFDDATVDVRLQLDATEGKLVAHGVLERHGISETSLSEIRVGNGEEWTGSCDEDGQFVLHLDKTHTIRFHDLNQQKVLAIEVPHEN